MNYTTTGISSIIHGKIFGEGNKNSFIRQLLIDSRKIFHAEASLFFAIKGERNDGHKFLIELYEKGVRNFVVSDLPNDIEKLTDSNFIKVDDTLHALQSLSVHHRKLFNIPVIGITGSNGKTVVKEWLYQLLREDKNIVHSPKSFNSQVGVPLSVWQMSEEHELAVFEAGISLSGEMEKLEKIIRPSIGIFTNIGQAHDENFLNTKQKIREKLKLFVHAHTLIFCRDYLELNEEIVKYFSAAFPGGGVYPLPSTKGLTPPFDKDSQEQGVRLFSWSKKTRADLQIGKITKSTSETEIQGVYKNDFIKIRIPFTDDASVENAIHCWALLLLLGYANDVIASRILNLSPVAMRLEMKEGINNCTLINDSYNSDLGSLSIALDFLNQQKHHLKKTLVLSDILQSGRDDEALYKEVAELVAKKGVTRLIGIGNAISEQANHFNVEKIFFKTTSDFLTHCTPTTFSGETVLLKGARTFGFEEISKVIQQKAHETVLEINLNAMIHNLNYFRSKLKPDTKIMAMVKAFSYGSGSFEIANVLQFHRVDYLAVAYADEGVELRKAGITLPIMVMNAEEQSYNTMIQHNLEPEIFSFRILNMFDEAIKRIARDSKEPFPIHIKLDTGMHRLGFEKQDLNELIERVRNTNNLKICSVFSHLSASDEAEHDAFTRYQVQLFSEMSRQLISHVDYPVLRHILNSAGIIRFPEAQFEMVRLGIGLYGIGLSDAQQIQLQNVSMLKTIISQIKKISTNETIGYSRKGIAKNDMTIATVPIGYADGLSRKLSNGKGKMLVNGSFAPIVGNVCMDMCMLDITGISVSEGDEVIVFGDKNPIAKIAKDMGTIPYEVLTNVSRRVKRVYWQE